MADLKAVIIDDDEKRLNLILSYMPSYIETVASKYGEGAKELILPSNGDMKASIVVMYADDHHGRSVQMYDWMISQNRNKKVYKIPVIFITKDSFSDRAFELMDIGDAKFYEYEEEIEDSAFFDAIMEALDEAEMMAGDVDEIEEVYPPVPEKEPSSPDKIMGMKFTVSNEAEAPQRSVVIKGEDRIKELLNSVNLSREKTIQVRELLEKITKEKIAAGEEIPAWAKKNKEPGVRRTGKSIVNKTPVKHKENVTTQNPVAQKTFEQKNVEQKPAIQKPDERTQASNSNRKVLTPYETSGLHNLNASDVDVLLAGIEPDNSFEERKDINAEKKKDVTLQMSDLGTNFFNGTFRGNDARQNVRNATNNVSAVSSSGRYKVLIVDTDNKTERACKLFLEDKYDYSVVDSSMKAIDYFVKNSAKVVIIDYHMPFVNGMQIYNSIKMQPYGANVKCVMLFRKEDDEKIINNAAKSPGVKGIVMKPFVKKQLVNAVESCL